MTSVPIRGEFGHRKKQGEEGHVMAEAERAIHHETRSATGVTGARKKQARTVPRACRGSMSC